MKKFKKVMALGLALALIFSSMGNVFAYTLDGKNYDGFQVGDTFYSLQYINSHVDSFRDVFSDEDPENVIIDFNKKPVEYQTLINAVSGGAVINDFDAWAATAARPNPPQSPNKLYKPDGTLVTIGEQELEVESVVALNRTNIEVEFSNGVTESFQVPALNTGLNTRTIRYEEKDFTVQVRYNPSDTTVENIEFVNYRNLKVTFSDIVDEESATDAANYYFEIVDGSAALGAFPTLKLSNQLSKIGTKYSFTYDGVLHTGADAWWNGHYDEVEEEWIYPRNIAANTVNGKTVVNIYLPEDARFTNVEDNKDSSDDPNDDDERTLTVLKRSSLHQREDSPAGDREILVKGTELTAAVRNVLDENGKASIDTFVKKIIIRDEVRPKLLSVHAYNEDGAKALKSNANGLELKLTDTFNILRDRPEPFDQEKQILIFKYSEPVFDTHGLNKSDFELGRDINAYVNGRLVATTNPSEADLNSAYPLMDFNSLLGFNMATDDSYYFSVIMTLDAQAAAKHMHDNWGEDFIPNKAYEFRIVGVTDLAGNIEAASEQKFNVVFVDEEPDNEPVLDPEVIDIEQVGDNMFRVEFNRAGVVGKLQILDADGNGGRVRVCIPKSAEDDSDLNKGRFFSYVAVPAMDHELYDPVLNVNILEKDNLLSYKGADYIFRTVQAVDIKTIFGREGADYEENMKLYNDIFSPEVVDATMELDYDEISSTIKIPIVDKIPASWADDDNVLYDVKPVKYAFDDVEDVFLNDIDVNTGDYLPLFVWYEDEKGARHSALVHNQDWLRPFDWIEEIADEFALLNPGFDNSITYDYGNNILEIDLTNYPELLEDGNMVDGVTYHVEFPSGYFTDPARDILLTHYEHQCDAEELPEFPHTLSNDTQLHFGGYCLDLLYVDDARIPNFESILDDILEYLNGNKRLSDRILCHLTNLGYVSLHEDVTIAVEAEPDEEDPRMYVPQTSKELIHYDQARDAASRDSIWVEFTGDIDVETLKNPENYMLFNEETTVGDLGVGFDDIVFDVSHGIQSAVINLPDDIIAEDGDYFFKVQGVSNPDGGTMTPVTTEIHLHDNTHPYILEAKVTAQNEIKLTFNEEIQYFVESVPTADKYSAAKNFKVYDADGDEIKVSEAIHSEQLDPNGRTVVLTVGDDVAVGDDLTIEVVEDPSGLILFIDLSSNKNTLKLESFEIE